MSENTCERCRFVDKHRLGDKYQWDYNCHRYAPRPGDRDTSWPAVEAKYWCGEFQPAEQAKEA